MTRNPLTSEEWAQLRASVQQSTADDSKKRWGQGRAIKPAEDAINLWAAQQLITQEEWELMEARHPGDLRKIAEELDLPVAAVIWRARSAPHQGAGQSVTLTPEALALLQKPATGSGGIQSLLRSLQANIEGDRLTVHPRQFERLREYLVNLGGGGRARLQSVMGCVLVAVAEVEGLRNFYRPEEALASARRSAARNTRTRPASKKSKPEGKRVVRGVKAAVPRTGASRRVEKPKPPAVKPAPEPAPEVRPAPPVQAIQWKLPVARKN